jgi:hypothetical protein
MPNTKLKELKKWVSEDSILDTVTRGNSVKKTIPGADIV